MNKLFFGRSCFAYSLGRHPQQKWLWEHTLQFLSLQIEATQEPKPRSHFGVVGKGQGLPKWEVVWPIGQGGPAAPQFGASHWFLQVAIQFRSRKGFDVEWAGFEMLSRCRTLHSDKTTDKNSNIAALYMRGSLNPRKYPIRSATDAQVIKQQSHMFISIKPRVEASST